MQISCGARSCFSIFPSYDRGPPSLPVARLAKATPGTFQARHAKGRERTSVAATIQISFHHALVSTARPRTRLRASLAATLAHRSLPRQAAGCMSRTESVAGLTQPMQRDLRWTIESYGNDARSGAHGRVAYHVAVAPCASSHPSRQHGIECDGDRSRETDLSSVRVSAQQQIKPGMCGLAVDFRCMRQQDRECPVGNRRPRFFDIVHPEIMRIVDSSDEDLLIAASDRLTFILQHSYAHGLKSGQHLDSIVVAEYAKNGLL